MSDQAPRTCIERLSAIELVPALSPRLCAPWHLEPYGKALDEAPGSDLQIVFAAPPQHGKTVLTIHALVKWLAAYPDRRFAYVTYNQDRADEVARIAQELAEYAGLAPLVKLRQWRVSSGAEVKFTSIGGSLTGYPVDGALIVDDPIKDREEANSPRYRDRAWNWLNDVALTRMHPDVPAVVMATRWHPDDPSGRCIKAGWDYINLKAVCDDPATDPLRRELGQVLWPEKRPLEFLEKHQINAYKWAALYQGEPRPRGAELFKQPTYFEWPEAKPTDGFRAGYGVDLAYTAKTHADWSVCLRGLKVGERLYLTDLQRKQVDAPAFTLTLKAKHTELRGPMRWYASGTEKGSAQFIQSKGIPLEAVAATSDKFVRAQAAADAWNDGRILVPGGERAPDWSAVLIDEVCGFTGIKDPHDDVVDALAALWDLLAVGAAKGTSKKFGLKHIPRLSSWDR